MPGGLDERSQQPRPAARGADPARALRARLDALNRKLGAGRKPLVTTAASLPAVNPPAARPLARLIYHRDLPRVESPAPDTAAGVKVTLEETIEGMELSGPDGGTVFLVHTPPAELPDADVIARRFADQLAEPASNLYRVLAAMDPAPAPKLDDLNPEHLVFLDIETTGLGNTPAFLVGLMTWTGAGFAVRQYLARHYAEEAAMILTSLGVTTAHRLLVTFNGKTFDVPYLRTRAVALGLPWALPLPHFDLLHVSRQLWRGHVPNCRLQTLEALICGRPRQGDIPGHEIPEAYHAFVRTGNAWQLVEILKHNRLDLLTMADLMTRFPPPPVP